MNRLGHVYLIGAGPGDPELLTLKAARLLKTADAVVHDRLVSPEILALVAPGARMFPVGKAPKSHPVPQDEINALLVRLAGEGKCVVRLKGGDPFIFGRGSEEAFELLAAGVPFDVVPGITAAQGCAAAARVPLTHRGLASGVRYVTGHCRADMPLDLDWKSLADPDTTLVVYMGAASIGEISRKLRGAGLDAGTPALAISNGTTPRESRVLARLDTIEAATRAAAFSGPVLFFIGRVAGLHAQVPCPTVAALGLRTGTRATLHA
jgi:uroporphyrin-III C-methyltransferase